MNFGDGMTIWQELAEELLARQDQGSFGSHSCRGVQGVASVFGAVLEALGGPAS